MYQIEILFMSINFEKTNGNQTLPWQSLQTFTASTTLSEKMWRVVNTLLFAAAPLAIYGFVSRNIHRAPATLFYASYLVLALTIRKIFSTIIGYAVYPVILFGFTKHQLAQGEIEAIGRIVSKGWLAQKITLHKSGISYDATIIGHKDTITNGKWCIHALGNFLAMEQVIENISYENHQNRANTLLINGPGVGRSQGHPTRYSMSAGFEAGLQFLEKEVKATHIVFKGFSLGGGMMSEAVIAHEFDPNIKYLGISDRTFSHLSDAAAAIVGSFVNPLLGSFVNLLFYLSGTELDTVSGAEKLKRLKIRHIIIQHANDDSSKTDGVIPDCVSLTSKLESCTTTYFLLSPNIPHDNVLPSDIVDELNQKIKAFLEEPKITIANSD